MKTRQSLVSNSSSTSFLVSYNPKVEICPCCGNYFDLIEEIEKSTRLSYESELQSTDLKEIIEKIEDDFGWDEKYVSELKDGIAKAQQDHPDWKFAHFSVAYCDNGLVEKINKMRDDGKCIIIRGEAE